MKKNLFIFSLCLLITCWNSHPALAVTCQCFDCDGIVQYSQEVTSGTVSCAEDICEPRGLYESGWVEACGESAPAECESTSDCLTGYECVDFECVADNSSSSDECSQDSDCTTADSEGRCLTGRCVYESDSTGTVDTPDTSGVNLINPLATSDVREILGTLIKAALGLSGSIALLMFIVGGFFWLTAGGNAEKIEKGKQVLIWATVGLVTIFFAYTIVNAVIKAITTGSVG